MNRRYDVITALDTCVDLVISGDDVQPVFGQTEKVVGDYSLVMGGSNCIFACQAAKLGLATAGVGVVGNDALGKVVKDGLNASGVDIARVAVSDECKTGIGVALCTSDDRAILTYLGSINPMHLETGLAELLPQTRHLHIGSYYLMTNLQNCYEDIAKLAKSNGVTISLDMNWDPSGQWDNGLRTLLPYVDILLPNANELCAITNEPDIDKAAQMLCQQVEMVAVKMGKEGASVYTKSNKPITTGIIQVDTVDAIGAGDSFDAGFVFGYLNGMTPKECLYYGSVCGSMSTRGHGGTVAQITKQELAQFAEKNKHYT